MAKRLFIGGCADGRMLEVPDGERRWNVPDWRPLVAWVNGRHSPNATFSHYPYERMEFAGSESVFIVFCLAGTTGDELIEKLIEGYAPTQPKRNQ